MENLFEAEFTISYIVFRSPDSDFIIARVSSPKIPEEYQKDTGKEITIKGLFPKADKGDVFRAVCRWAYDPRYGYSLDVSAPLRVLPSNINGIKQFLIKNVKGVGERTVDKIIKQFGEASLDRIKEGRLSEIKSISEKVRTRIESVVLESKILEDLSLYLFKRGITNYSDILDIYNEFKEKSLDMIISSPYSICTTKLSRFPLADKIALGGGLSPDATSRIERLILYYIHDNMFSSGNLYETERDIIEKLPSFIRTKKLTPVTCTPESLSGIIDGLVKNGSLKEERDQERLLYLPWVYKREKDTAEMVRKMLDESPESYDYDISGFLKTYSERTGIILDKVQEKGVENAVNHKISILTGGPGTGKTLTINIIIQCLDHLFPDAEITLAAPTGRASRRMSEMTGLNASTIHRFLHLTANWEKTDEDISIESDFVIVDEASMIDHNLFYILLKAVYDAGAALILVGDKDQLPPVGAGLPFRDLIESGAVPVVRLTTLYRQAGESQINLNAKSILGGITRIGEDGLRFDIEKQDFFFFAAYTPEQIRDLVIRSFDGLRKIGTPPDDITVLTPMKKTEVGVISLNRLLQEHLNPPHPDKDEIKIGSTIFRVGDRVMQTVNNYELGVMNGDVGKISSIWDEDRELVITYDDYKIEDGKLVSFPRDVTYEYKNLSELSLSYATTVHKSQGSEYPIVIMPLSPLLINTSRTILYTAVTRAKQKFIFIGDTDSLRRGIEKVEETKRNTRLRERIGK